MDHGVLFVLSSAFFNCRPIVLHRCPMYFGFVVYYCVCSFKLVTKITNYYGHTNLALVQFVLLLLVCRQEWRPMCKSPLTISIGLLLAKVHCRSPGLPQV